MGGGGCFANVSLNQMYTLQLAFYDVNILSSVSLGIPSVMDRMLVHQKNKGDAKAEFVIICI